MSRKNNSFLYGMGSIILFPEEREMVNGIPTDSVNESIMKDWEAIGKDMWIVMKENTPNEHEQTT